MPKNKPAFTLLESLIVMAVTVIILGLGMVGFNGRSANQLQQKLFWQSFQRQWKYAERYAVASQSDVRIVFLKHHLQFIYVEPCYNQVINYPKGMEQLQPYDSLLIKAGGYVSPKTVHWRLVDDAKIIKQTFQLGWGIYRVKE